MPRTRPTAVRFVHAPLPTRRCSFAPRVTAEGIKAPSPLQAGGKLDPASANSGYQVRVGASFSPLNFYKGLRVKDVGEADCQEHDTVMTARELLGNAQDIGRLAALREQARLPRGTEADVGEHRTPG